MTLTHSKGESVSTKRLKPKPFHHRRVIHPPDNKVNDI